VLLNEILKGIISVGVALNNIEPATAHLKDDSERSAPLLQPHGRQLSLSQRKREGSITTALGQEEAWEKRRSPSTSLRRSSRWYTSYTQWSYRSQKLLAEVSRWVSRSYSGKRGISDDATLYFYSPDCWKLAVPACCYVLQNNVSDQSCGPQNSAYAV
jgi:hypothetical protein